MSSSVFLYLSQWSFEVENYPDLYNPESQNYKDNIKKKSQRKEKGAKAGDEITSRRLLSPLQIHMQHKYVQPYVSSNISTAPEHYLRGIHSHRICAPDMPTWLIRNADFSMRNY